LLIFKNLTNNYIIKGKIGIKKYIDIIYSYRYITTNFLFFISSNCLVCHEIHSRLQYIFHLIVIFMQLCSNDVCQLNIFYVSHMNISILF